MIIIGDRDLAQKDDGGDDDDWVRPGRAKFPGGIGSGKLPMKDQKTPTL